MRPLHYFLPLAALAALAALALLAPNAQAEMLVLRYVPVDACGTTRQVPNGPDGTLGAFYRGYALSAYPYTGTITPTHMVTFTHPATGRNVTVPLTLPEGTPRYDHRYDRIIYNYGSYVVEARFLPDGSVETVYNSGFLRPLVLR